MVARVRQTEEWKCRAKVFEAEKDRRGYKQGSQGERAQSALARSACEPLSHAWPRGAAVF